MSEQHFHTVTSKTLNTGHADKSTKIVHEDIYKYPKKPANAFSLKTNSTLQFKLSIISLFYHLMKAQLIQLERIGYYTEHMKDLNKYMQIMASIAQQPVKKPNA